MKRYRMTCPECGSAVIADYPQVLVWEICPSCRKHMWDTADILMAEICSSRPDDVKGLIIHQGN